MSCLSVKNKTSTERCTARALRNCMYCKRHMKMRTPIPWVTPSIGECIIKFQALWRGFQARVPLKLAGKGVLKRSLCHNEEEIVTLETNIHPYDFFSIEEDGKLWWFDQRTLYQWSLSSMDIINPYTRTQLKPSDTKRLRAIIRWRKRNKLSLYHEDPPVLGMLERRDLRWMRVAQVLREDGHSIHYEHFNTLSYSQFIVFVNSILEDIRWWTYEKQNRTRKYYLWLKNLRNIMHSYHQNRNGLSCDIGSILMMILDDIKHTSQISYYIYTGYQHANSISDFPFSF